MASLDRPYFFRYTQEPETEISYLLGKDPPLRPAVAVALSYLGEVTLRVSALVDSGAERVFAAPVLARQLRLNLDDAPSGTIGLGGAPRRVRFHAVTIQLFQDLLVNDDRPLTEWEADVAFLAEWDPSWGWGMLLGRDGFFNQFTVTMQGSIPGMVLEDWGAFDERFSSQIEDADTRQPRFRP